VQAIRIFLVLVRTHHALFNQMILSNQEPNERSYRFNKSKQDTDLVTSRGPSRPPSFNIHIRYCPDPTSTEIPLMASLPRDPRVVEILAPRVRRNNDTNDSLLHELSRPQVHASTTVYVGEGKNSSIKQSTCSLSSLPPELRMEIFKLVVDDYSMSKRSYYRNSFRNVNSDTFEIWTGNEVFRSSDSRKMLDRLPPLERALIGNRTLYREIFSTRIKSSTIRLWAKPVEGEFQFPNFEEISPLLRKSMRKVIISTRFVKQLHSTWSG
jgi:hypothetical protein